MWPNVVKIVVFTPNHLEVYTFFFACSLDLINFTEFISHALLITKSLRSNMTTLEFRLDGTKINGENEASC